MLIKFISTLFPYLSNRPFPIICLTFRSLSFLLSKSLPLNPYLSKFSFNFLYYNYYFPYITFKADVLGLHFDPLKHLFFFSLLLFFCIFIFFLSPLRPSFVFSFSPSRSLFVSEKTTLQGNLCL